MTLYSVPHFYITVSTFLCLTWGIFLPVTKTALLWTGLCADMDRRCVLNLLTPHSFKESSTSFSSGFPFSTKQAKA